MIEKNRRAILGLFLVLIGVFVLLDNFHLLPRMPWWIFQWYTILLIIGVFNLLVGNRAPAIILIGIYLLFLFDDIYFFDWRDFWPVILIIIGLAFIFRQKKISQSRTSIDDNFFDAVSIFGGSNQRVTSHKLEGGKITSIFGGSEIDLREAKPVDGASIEIFTMFGGSTIIVPPEWEVNVEVVAILGGFEDKRTSTQSEKGPRIRLKGLTMLGGGEIRS